MTKGLGRLLCKPGLDIDHTSASNTDQLVTQQAIGPFENLSRIPWSGLAADMISNLVNAGGVPGTNDPRSAWATDSNVQSNDPCRSGRPSVSIASGPCQRHESGSCTTTLTGGAADCERMKCHPINDISIQYSRVSAG